MGHIWHSKEKPPVPLLLTGDAAESTMRMIKAGNRTGSGQGDSGQGPCLIIKDKFFHVRCFKSCPGGIYV